MAGWMAGWLAGWLDGRPRNRIAERCSATLGIKYRKYAGIIRPSNAVQFFPVTELASNGDGPIYFSAPYAFREIKLQLAALVALFLRVSRRGNVGY